jgi:hypothetical protein
LGIFWIVISWERIGLDKVDLQSPTKYHQDWRAPPSYFFTVFCFHILFWILPPYTSITKKMAIFPIQEIKKKYRVLKHKFEKNKGLCSRKVDRSRGRKQIWWCRRKMSLPCVWSLQFMVCLARPKNWLIAYVL